MTNLMNQPVTLPCGAVLPNRIAKAAMTEGMATPAGVPTKELENLYGMWSDGGAGLLLSGNIQVDGDHLERPGNVIVDSEPSSLMHAALSSLAQAATRNGNHFWAQISHAGRQTQKPVNPKPKAPSAVKVGLPGGQFGMPVALTGDEIEDIISRFAVCAKAVKEAGFTGVQVHSAHGYLFSQFLSPRTNLREDQYGGTLENRARALLETIRAVRQAVGNDFPVAVKLNSADFQKGGFAFEDSLQVAKWLQEASVDLIEISGGTYEQPKLLGLDGIEEEETQNVKQSTLMREAYFVDFALAMQEVVTIPLMVTGGFRRSDVIEEALSSGAADVIGIGRPMCVDVDAPNSLLNGAEELVRYENQLSLFPSSLSFLSKLKALNALASFAVQFWYYSQLFELAEKGKADSNLSVFKAVKLHMKRESVWLKARKELG